jgi:hypothetical protein
MDWMATIIVISICIAIGMMIERLRWQIRAYKETLRAEEEVRYLYAEDIEGRRNEPNH